MNHVLRNLPAVALLTGVHAAVYGLLNRFPPFPPRRLPLSAIDRAMPFWTWTVWAYFLLIGMAIVLPLLISDRLIFRRIVVGYGVAMGLAVVFFTLMPTVYDRPDVPMGSSLSDIAYRWLISIDGPCCCFPSAHVLVPLLACAGLWSDGRRGGIWPPLAFAVCALSILTTKQHYAWDLFGGTAVGVIGLLVARQVVRVDRRDTSVHRKAPGRPHFLDRELAERKKAGDE